MFLQLLYVHFILAARSLHIHQILIQLVIWSLNSFYFLRCKCQRWDYFLGFSFINLCLQWLILNCQVLNNFVKFLIFLDESLDLFIFDWQFFGELNRWWTVDWNWVVQFDFEFSILCDIFGYLLLQLFNLLMLGSFL